MKRAHYAARHEAGGNEPLQVVAQGGRRQVHVRLNVACRSAGVAALNYETQYREPDWMAQRAKLLRVAVEFGGHEFF